MATIGPSATPSPTTALSRGLSAMALTQTDFDNWASSVEPWKVGYTRWMLTLILGAAILGMLLLAPPVVREAKLLWFGERAEGWVTSVDVQLRGSTKSGSPIYRVDLGYEFETTLGARHAGKTSRTVNAVKPEFDIGAAVTIYYDAGDPRRSVAEYQLRSDVYGAFFLLGLIALSGIALPALWLRRFAGWRLRHVRVL